MRQEGRKRPHYQYHPTGAVTPQELMNFLAADPEVVVNTTDQVPESFDSIAATFGFEHHVGTDASLELKVIKCILRRETLLSRVRTMVGKLSKDLKGAGPSSSPPRHHNAQSLLLQEHAGLLDCLALVREATADTIEAVVLWREGLPVYPPPAFIWERRNYLLKMHRDMDFLANAEPLVTALQIPQDKLRSNPLMLSDTLRDQPLDRSTTHSRGDDQGSEASSSSAQDREDGERGRLATLGKVLVMEARFEAERHQTMAKTDMAEQYGLGPSVLMGRTVPDPNLWRKKVNVFNWFDEAQGQLKSLRKSMEQGQLVLRALGDQTATAMSPHAPSQALLDDAAATQRLLHQQHLDRLVPLATKAPNPANNPFPRPIDLSPNGHAYRHPLEVEDLQWGTAPYPVPFTRELNQALILKADRRKKLPPRSFLPKALANVQSRYREPQQRPMTPAEFERYAALREQQPRLLEQPPPSRKAATSEGLSRSASSPMGQGGGGEGEEGAFSVASMKDPLGYHREEDQGEEGGGPTAAAKRRQRSGNNSQGQKVSMKEEDPMPTGQSKAKGCKKPPLDDIILEDDEGQPAPSSSSSGKAASGAGVGFPPAKVTPRLVASTLREDDLVRLGQDREPTKALAVAGAAVLILLAPGNEVPNNVTWPAFQARISSRGQFLKDLAGFQANHVPHFKTRALRNFVTCGSEMLPAGLLDHGLSAAKVSAWVFQVLLLQPDFVKHAGKSNVRSVTASIKKVLRVAGPPSTASTTTNPTSAAPLLVYNKAHQLKDKTVFVSITQSGGGGGGAAVTTSTIIKVYDPVGSHELQADLPAPSLPQAASGGDGGAWGPWVDAHLGSIAAWDEQGRIKLMDKQ